MQLSERYTQAYTGTEQREKERRRENLNVRRTEETQAISEKAVQCMINL
jgi:hypothetical protein